MHDQFCKLVSSKMIIVEYGKVIYTVSNELD